MSQAPRLRGQNVYLIVYARCETVEAEAAQYIKTEAQRRAKQAKEQEEREREARERSSMTAVDHDIERDREALERQAMNRQDQDVGGHRQRWERHAMSREDRYIQMESRKKKPRTELDPSSISSSDKESESSSPDEIKDDQLSDGNSRSDMENVAVYDDKTWETPEDRDIRLTKKFCQYMRSHPACPPHPQDAQRSWADMKSGVEVPSLHCAFKGCSWTSENLKGKHNLEAHLLGDQHTVNIW